LIKPGAISFLDKTVVYAYISFEWSMAKATILKQPEGGEALAMNFITISEMLGTNGETIARKVARIIQYPFYGKEELFKAAEAMGLFQDIKDVQIKNPPLLEKLLSDRPKIYLDRFQSVIYEVAKKGNALFFGKGSTILLRSFDCALHVLVIGSTEKRIQRVTETNHVEREVAEKMVQTSDHEKRGFLRYAFDQNWPDPLLYDLTVNTDMLNIDTAVKIIVEAAKAEEIKACGVEAVKLLGKFSLQRKIESALLEAGIMSSHLFFKVEDTDSVRLFGSVGSSAEKKEVVKLLQAIEDIKNIRDDLTILTMR
jgi:cytidylate kinase